MRCKQVGAIGNCTNSLSIYTTLLWALFSLNVSGCAQGTSDSLHTETISPVPKRPIFLEEASPADFRWADSLVQTQSMDWQLGQLFMVPLYSRELHASSYRDVYALVRDHRVGGVICMQGEASIQRQHLLELDSTSRANGGVGLLTSMDAEWGSAMRLSNGLSFPHAMAIGATGNALWAQAVGMAVGRSLKRDGIDVNFAPVADVNNNPANPVIGTRSFGSDPTLVGAMATAFSRGLQSGGVLGCGKHFPGHGDTDIDSHHGLPLITGDSARLESVELLPFRSLVYGGVDGMMTAHLVVPGLDSTSGLPASLSPIVVGEKLRGKGPGGLGFEGLVFTDALTMAGAADAVPPGEREVLALLAGNDVLLFPSNVPLALDSLNAALASGRLDSAVVSTACRSVLLAGRWAHRQREASQPNETENLQTALRAAMLTVVVKPILPASAQTLASFPWPPYTRVSVLNLNRSGKAFCDEVKKSTACDCLHHQHLPPKKDWPALIDKLSKNAQVLVNVVDESNKPGRNFGVPNELSDFLAALEGKAAVGLTLFTSPYATAHVGEGFSGPVMVAYHQDELTLRSAARAWSGTGDALGRMPVSAGPWALGDGLQAKATRLAPSAKQSNIRWVQSQERLDSLMEDALALGAFPGARLLILHRGEIQVDASYGHIDESRQQPVGPETVYDLASITKVATTTLLTAQAVDQGLIDLDAPIASMHPKILDPNLGKRTLRQILSHTAGLPSWIPFYQSVVAAHDSTQAELYASTKDQSLDICAVRIGDLREMNCRWVDTLRQTIYAVEPDPPGRYRYSDLGYYLLQEILEDRLGAPLDQLARELIYTPLQLRNIGFTPTDWAPLAHIAPTELDTVFRMEMVHGRVHDPGAAMLGGIAGHAGLFSDAHDLALLMECIRGDGEWNGKRILTPDALTQFTERTWPELQVRRGLGWDKPGLESDTGASCDEASWESFGHSGFTGTLVWIDPEAEMTFIFLSNRIHPDPQNRTLIREDIRTKAMSIVYQTLHINSRFEEQH